MAGVSSSHSLPGPVSVVVIAYNDAEHLGAAVTSALAQGEAVGEVIVVDDASTDATGATADRIAAASPRVRVIHRTVNSGGCGTPRNDGVDAARGAWVAFLDSDDVLPTGAVDALLAAAERHGADVAAGLCMRLELPDRREMPWQPELFTEESVHDGLAARPETVWDTLSVNKLYRRDFLSGKGIRFPDGAAHYEDFVFSAQVYAAAPRLAVIPDTVYLWHTRPTAANPSISLRRDRIANWRDRIAAHAGAVAALRSGGENGLALAAERKFAAYDVPMYLRDLHRRPAEYVREWWAATREHLAGFDPAALDGADPATRWRTAVLQGRAEPADASLPRLAELSAVPPRLAPPYAGTERHALWDEREPAVELAGLADAALDELPLCVEASVRTGRTVELELTLRELYGRVAAAGPSRAEVAFRHRRTGRELPRDGLWEPTPDGAWRTEVSVPAAALRERGRMAAWDLLTTVVFADGTRASAKPRAAGGLGRGLVLTPGAALLVQAYATTDASLALRVAEGIAGARAVLAGRRTRQR
jgi:GT2 family glycosyltransferase